MNIQQRKVLCIYKEDKKKKNSKKKKKKNSRMHNILKHDNLWVLQRKDHEDIIFSIVL